MSQSLDNQVRQGAQGQNELSNQGVRATAIATPSFRTHKPGIEAGNGRREVEPTTKNPTTANHS